MVLYASGEDYLEAILVLQRKMGAVRSVDLARHMNFSKPSISNAVGLLKKGGFLEVDGNGSLLLTGLNRRSLILYPTELQAHISYLSCMSVFSFHILPYGSRKNCRNLLGPPQF